MLEIRVNGQGMQKPAVLVAYNKFTRMEEGVKFIVDDSGNHNTLHYLLGDKKIDVVNRAASYVKVSRERAAPIPPKTCSCILLLSSNRY